MTLVYFTSSESEGPIVQRHKNLGSSRTQTFPTRLLCHPQCPWSFPSREKITSLECPVLTAVKSTSFSLASYSRRKISKSQIEFILHLTEQIWNTDLLIDPVLRGWNKIVCLYFFVFLLRKTRGSLAQI